MVINCVAFGCNNLADKRSVVQFHGFPFKRPLILKEWIKAIRRDNWQPMKFSKLYSDHFLTSDYEDIGEKIYRRLKDSAIPSVFKFPQHLQKKIAPRRVLKRCLPNHTVGGDNNLNEDLNEIRLLSVQTPMIQEEETQISVGSQTDKMVESPTKIMLRKKILNQKVRRKVTKISTLNELVQELKQNNCTTDNLTPVMENYFEGIPLEYLLNQYRN
ncbi:hypothetical protein NQ314_002402 [Rhamnusium bicolor]|uniref:THAP-type domain-containing protein n=1 Tax=Rhamnusium bicolor TaxID=1586634 RepID=A0AAV8ZT39_9CUCU|nr:hypothetical protein NQ314_002402 [Rhamnusium bicolor]